MIARRSAVSNLSAMPTRGRSTHYFLVLGGATYGLNAPPGTADATGLSNPSLLTDETPNTQSSTRTCGSTALHPVEQPVPATERETSQLFASVRRHRTLYDDASPTAGQVKVVSVDTAPSIFGSGGGGALAIPASAATLSLVILAR